MTMHAEYVQTGAAATRRASSKNPMEMLARLRDRHPTASFEQQFTDWCKAVERDQEASKAALLYAFRNYWTALDRDEIIKERQKESGPDRVTRQAVQRTADQAEVQRFKQFVFLTMLMPNGKTAIDCTGPELCKFGQGWDRVGKKIGNQTLRASGLREDQVRKLVG